MKGITINNLVRVTGGFYYGEKDILEKEITNVFIDSRKVTEGSLFIPIVGERADGHEFIQNVFEAGALCTLSEKKLASDNIPYILVPSSLQALKDIAEFYLEQLNIKVVGITGSVGKTSTKEMVASVLSTQFNILKTNGNYNNEIGLPLTVFRLTGNEEVAVLEMGISDFGEMSRLTKIAKPDIAVITNIGLCHLENLKSRDGILEAKTEIFKGLKENGTICLNGDDDKLRTVTSYKNNEVIFFGNNEINDIYAKDIVSNGLKGTECIICTPKGDIHVQINVPGVHMVYNALAACSVGMALGVSLNNIKAGIENLKPVSGRVNIIETSNFTIIDDCYNANPVSMKSSVDILKEALGRKVCILGDMFELGENEIELHKSVGCHIKDVGIDVLVTIGNLSQYIIDGTSNSNVICFHYNTKQDAIAELKMVLQSGDSILVKASHGMEFNEIVDYIKAYDNY